MEDTLSTCIPCEGAAAGEGGRQGRSMMSGSEHDGMRAATSELRETRNGIRFV